jgi:REP element-mobilizing transposase RayT
VEQNWAPEVQEALLGRWEPVYRSQLQYLVTWSTRGRKPILRDRHSTTLLALIPAICEERDVQLLDVAVGVDHVHTLLSLRPSETVASVVREVKGRAGILMLERHPELRVWLGGNLVWDERYAVETVSASRSAHVQSRLRSLHPGRRLDAQDLEGLAAAS